MLNISDILRENLQKLNKELLQKYRDGGVLGLSELRRLISENIGPIRRLRKLSAEDLGRWTGGKAIAGVDGSVNIFGGTYPHYVAILQAFAKSTASGNKGITLGGLHTPLLRGEGEDANRVTPGPGMEAEPGVGAKAEAEGISDVAGRDARMRASLLARLEVEAAFRAVDEFDPRLILMDGSLVRFRIECGDEWENFCQLAVRRGVVVAGVIEAIGTHEISERLRDKLPPGMRDMYDREMLFGLLEYGEGLDVWHSGFKRGLRTSFLRTSRDPGVVGVDILESQVGEMSAVADLIFTLTPEHGRGIPVWLDMIDADVRITNRMVEALIDTYIDPDLKRKLLVTKRSERIY